MRKVFGFVDLFNAPELGPLTEKRNFGAVTFLGRYGLIDFALSNFANSKINRIGIIVDKYSSSVRSHIQNGSAFISNTKTGCLHVMFNERALRKSEPNTDIETINISKEHFTDGGSEIIIVAPVYILASMDFNPFIESHIRSGKDVTLVYEHRFDLDKTMKGMNILNIKGNIVKGIKRNDQKDKEGDVSLDIFIMNRDFFDHILSSQREVNIKYGIREMIKYEVTKNKVEANSYEFKGFVLPILNLDDYINGSFYLLPYLNRLKVFKDGWPIYTATHNTPPAKYGPKANVKNSFIANGSIIDGTVENSILSRNVVVKAGASVKNSIVFTSTEIGRGSSLNYVLTDKSAKIGEKVSLTGNKKEYVIVKQGEKL